MPATQSPEVLDFAIALLISLVSGFISISRRILQGQPAKLLWILSEGFAAILCGCLAYDTYPTIASSLPEWVTPPVAVAFAAHGGSRVFQEAEKSLLERYVRVIKDK